MDKPKKQIHHKIRHLVVSAPSKGAQAIRIAHHHTLVRPHEHLVRKSKVYAGWHGKKHHSKVHALALAMFILVAIVGSLGLSNMAKAFSTLTQTDWSGGVGTSTTNQYSAATNVNTATSGQVSMGASTIADWCNTANCGTSMDYRKKIYIRSTMNVTNYQVRVNVAYVSGMQSDFDDLRFVNASGTDAPHYVVAKTDSVSAEVMVKVDTLSAGMNTLSMYYGNSGVASVASGEATFDFFDDFSGGSLDLTKWQNAGQGSFTVGSGNLNIVTSGGNDSIKLKDDVMSRAGGGIGSVYEYSPQIQQFGAQNDCAAAPSLWYFGSNLATSPLTDQFGLEFGCNEYTVGYKSRGVSVVAGNTLAGTPTALSDLAYGASNIHYRIGLDNSGAYNLQQYSTDAGATWTLFDNPDLRQYGTVNDPFKFFFFAAGTGTGTQVQIPSLYRYKTGANEVINTTSIVESSPANGGKLATLTSAIFDSGNTGTQYFSIHVTHTDDGSAAPAPMVRI